MKTMAEHFNRVNDSTLYGNYNTGQIVDPLRYSMQQKIQKQFESGKKIEYNYNNQNNFKDDVSNLASNQLQQIGYRYGNT
jgi:hypothetical protein